MRKISNTLIIILGVLLIACKSTKVSTKNVDVIQKQESWGITEYERGNYQAAYQNLAEIAAWGYKDAQYAIAFMFLKGQFVEQSSLIGMAWLGVAIEAGIQERTEMFDKLYAAASEQEQQQFDKVIALYKSRYGLKAQRVTCRKTDRPSSKKIIVHCTKGDDLFTVQPIDLVVSDIKFNQTP